MLGEDGKITIFKILCNTLSGFAILAIGWETAYLAARSKSFDNPRSFVQEFVLEKMLPTVLVAAALSNNGYIAGHALYQSKNMFLGIDKVAYESFMFKAGTAGLAKNPKQMQPASSPRLAMGLKIAIPFPIESVGKLTHS